MGDNWQFNAEEFKRLRREAGMTQSAAAALLGVSVVSVYFWENLRRRPRIVNLKRIADAFKLKSSAPLIVEEKICNAIPSKI